MPLRLIIAALIGIVMGLAGLAIYQGRQLREAQRQLDAAFHTPPEVPASTNQRPIRLRLQQLPPLDVRTQVRDLDWSSIESPDYLVYIANLRRVGCPEETIRDIILADIDQHYAEKRHALQPPPADFDFWRHPDDSPSRAEAKEAERMREAELAALEQERRHLIIRLLGPSALEAELARLTADEFQDRNLQFLPIEKRRAVAEALARWRQSILEGRANPDEAARLEQTSSADQLLEQQMATLLTPEERDQYEMRASPLAERLRERLRGFGASRDEFEQLFRMERALNEQASAIIADASSDPQANERLQAAEADFDRKVRELLGPQRLTDYQRSLDSDYQTLYSLALDHQVPATVANQVWDMRRAVEVQSGRIRDNPLLTPDQKVAALTAIRRETESAIIDVLGEPLLDAYQQHGGGWLDNLTTPGPEILTVPAGVEATIPDGQVPPGPTQVLVVPIPAP